MDMFCWSPEFLNAYLRGLIATASCLHSTWLQKQEVHTSDWVTIAWVHLPQSITFISRFSHLHVCLSCFLHLTLLIFLLPSVILWLNCLQAYYLAVPFPIEKAASKSITRTTGGVEISEILNYPVRGLIFEGGTTLEDLSNVVSDSCICLQQNNIPYNVLISDSGKRIFLLPQVKNSRVMGTLRALCFACN